MGDRRAAPMSFKYLLFTKVWQVYGPQGSIGRIELDIHGRYGYNSVEYTSSRFISASFPPRSDGSIIISQLSSCRKDHEIRELQTSVTPATSSRQPSTPTMGGLYSLDVRGNACSF